MKIEKNYDLSSLNTFGMKAKCAVFLEYESAKELESVDWDSLPKPLLPLGCGSNLLFTKDFPGTVLHSGIKYIKYVDMGLDELPVMVGSGVIFDDLIVELCKNNLWGAENLSLIPGEVGASVVQNMGAYGVEVKDIVTGVSCFDLQERKSVKFKASECEFAYRDSFFKHNPGRYLVTSVLIRVSRKRAPRLEYKALSGIDASSPQSVREAIIKIREDKLPDPAKTGSAGSYFKNPVVSAAQFVSISQGYSQVPHYVLDGGFVKVPAAWMIEQCGLKGATLGGAAVWKNQPLVLVNASGNATADEILALEKKITDAVKEKFGVTLETEVQKV